MCSEGLGYYFQNSKEILKTSMWMMFIGMILRWLMWILFLVVGFLICLPIFHVLVATYSPDLMQAADPTGPTAFAQPDVAAIFGSIMGALVFAGICVYSVERAFLHPIYLTMVLTKYLLVIQTQPLNPDFERYLGSPRALRLRDHVSRMSSGRT